MHRSPSAERAHAGVRDRIGIALLRHRQRERQGLGGKLHDAKRHLGGFLRRGLDGGGARGLLGVAALGQAEGRHDGVERRGVLVDQRQELGLDLLALLGPLGKFLPTRVPAGLVGGKVGDHGAERGPEGADVGRDGAAAGGRTLAGGLVRERPEIQSHQFPLGGVPEQVFDHALLGFERREFIQTQRPDGDLDQLGLGDADGALLLAQEIAAGLEQRLQRHQADQLGAGHAQAAFGGLAASLVEGHMHRRHGEIGQIDRDLGDAIFLDEPPDRLHGLQTARDGHGRAGGVFDDLALRVLLRPAGLADVKGHGVGAPGRGGVEVDVVGDQEVARPDDRGAASGVKGRRAEVGFPLRQQDLLGEALVFAGADHGEAAPDRVGLRRLIKIDRQVEFVTDPPGQLAGVHGGLLHREAGNGDQRADIRCTHARVRTGVA